jgi:hypothetical protein
MTCIPAKAMHFVQSLDLYYANLSMVPILIVPMWLAMRSIVATVTSQIVTYCAASGASQACPYDGSCRATQLVANDRSTR